jgi:hypothetical protein
VTTMRSFASICILWQLYVCVHSEFQCQADLHVCSLKLIINTYFLEYKATILNSKTSKKITIVLLVQTLSRYTI